MKNKNNNLTKQTTLTQEQSDLITKHAALQAMVDTRKDELMISSIDYNRERETFIAQYNSKKTKEQYNYGLTKLEAYCEKQGISVLDIKPAFADDFIMELRKPEYNLSSATVRVSKASACIFFTFLERRHPVIRNPFKGTHALPPKQAAKTIGVPTKKDIDTLIKNVPNDTVRAAIIFMCETGIRAGGLDTLTIKNNKYFCYSKGKNISGIVSKKAIDALKKYKLNLLKPFENIKSSKVQDCVRRAAKRLHTRELISVDFSAHDLRHYFAVSLYKKTKDIYAVKDALNHSNVATTDGYLKSLSVDI